MEEIAGWVASIATMIAAVMVAANLGTRITGWGFVVFTFGSLSWSLVAVLSGQNSLLITNGFLTIVNLAGIWRWLGRQTQFEHGMLRGRAQKPCGPCPIRVFRKFGYWLIRVWPGWEKGRGSSRCSFAR